MPETSVSIGYRNGFNSKEKNGRPIRDAPVALRSPFEENDAQESVAMYFNDCDRTTEQAKENMCQD